MAITVRPTILDVVTAFQSSALVNCLDVPDAVGG